MKLSTNICGTALLFLLMTVATNRAIEYAYALVSTSSRSQRKSFDHLDDRRAFLAFVATTGGITLSTPGAVQAQEEEEESPMLLSSLNIETTSTLDRGGKPFAPVEALLPATRLKLWLDDIHVLSSHLSTTKDPNERYQIVQDMNSRLSNPPPLFDSKNKQRTSLPSSATTAQLTPSISTANKDQYQSNRKDLSVGDKVTAMLNQADVERQWGMLQYAESKREESNEFRAAFNFYTRSLSFGTNYVLTASKEERKKMIRNDALPSLTAVITSDLDRRDLYRNQFLTAIEDLRAEVAYQAKKNVQELDELDSLDIIELEKEAFVACDNWFSLIAPQDVQEAIDAL